MALSPAVTTTEDDIAGLEALCERLVEVDELANLEWLDGYMAALAAGPRHIELDEWLAVFADGLFARVFTDPAEAAQARELIGKRWSEICAQLDAKVILDEPNLRHLDPLMYRFDADEADDLDDEGDDDSDELADWVEDATILSETPATPATTPAAAAEILRNEGDADDDADSDEDGDEDSELDLPPEGWPGDGVYWSLGFIDAVEDFAADWVDPDPESEDAQTFSDLLESIGLLALDDEEQRAESVARLYDGADLDREELINEALYAVQELRMYWITHAPKAQTRRVENKVGRNDPCPCGSGKKYKKCHGAND
jgi:uncharacterized protein